MVDPDAPSRDDAVKGPVLHWLVANFQAADLQDGRTLCKFSFQIFFLSIKLFFTEQIRTKDLHLQLVPVLIDTYSFFINRLIKFRKRKSKVNNVYVFHFKNMSPTIILAFLMQHVSPLITKIFL